MKSSLVEEFFQHITNLGFIFSRQCQAQSLVVVLKFKFRILDGELDVEAVLDTSLVKHDELLVEGSLEWGGCATEHDGGLVERFARGLVCERCPEFLMIHLISSMK